MKYWRYAEGNDPQTPFSGWYVAFLDESGSLAVLSDYGDYSYRWNPAGMPEGGFRKFLAECSEEYIHRKLSPKVFSLEKSVEAFEHALADALGENTLDSDDVRQFREEAKQCSGEYEFISLVQEADCDLDECWLLDFSQQSSAFMKNVWPRLIRKIVEDIRRAPVDAKVLPLRSEIADV